MSPRQRFDSGVQLGNDMARSNAPIVVGGRNGRPGRCCFSPLTRSVRRSLRLDSAVKSAFSNSLALW